MKEHSTKKSLKASGLALMLCIAMLIGTTFAWFTDSITNSGNKIQAGSLDIGATAYDIGTGGTSVTISGINNDGVVTFEATGEDLETSTTPIISEELFEPGKSNAKLLKVQNNGNLAAKIKLSFDVTDGGLQNALWFDFVQVDENGQATGNFTKRPMGELTALAEKVEVPLDSKQSVRFVLIYGMSEDAGNEYQGKTFTADVIIHAKQNTVEKDGFGNSDYDKDAEFATPVSNSEEFVQAVQNGGAIELKENITLTNEYLEVKKDLKIIGNGKTLQAPETGEKKDRVINVANTSEPVTITLQDVNIQGPEEGAYNRGISFYNTKEVNLIMDRCSVSTNYYAINIALDCQDVNVTIKNSTLTGYAALQTHSPNTKITLENCELVGNNSFEQSEWNSFATVVINQTASNTNLVLNHCTIKANQPTGNNQFYLSVRSENNQIELNNCKYLYNGVEQTLEEAMNNVQLYSANNSIKVDGVDVVK